MSICKPRLETLSDTVQSPTSFTRFSCILSIITCIRMNTRRGKRHFISRSVPLCPRAQLPNIRYPVTRHLPQHRLVTTAQFLACKTYPNRIACALVICANPMVLIALCGHTMFNSVGGFMNIVAVLKQEETKLKQQLSAVQSAISALG